MQGHHSPGQRDQLRGRRGARDGDQPRRAHANLSEPANENISANITANFINFSADITSILAPMFVTILVNLGPIAPYTTEMHFTAP